jgi:crotonobetainyl-CoA:carnitine CoA-transferase CaiB-like acyl-CoA transferase
MRQPSGPLAGIKVLDLTSVLYGPYASQTLGDWGAEVIKIEPLTGDTWRYSGQFRNRGMTGQFMAVNRNKRSLALDLKQPDGKSVLQRLIAKADVLLTNIRPGGIGKTGLRL